MNTSRISNKSRIARLRLGMGACAIAPLACLIRHMGTQVPSSIQTPADPVVIRSELATSTTDYSTLPLGVSFSDQYLAVQRWLLRKNEGWTLYLKHIGLTQIQPAVQLSKMYRQTIQRHRHSSQRSPWVKLKCLYWWRLNYCRLWSWCSWV